MRLRLLFWFASIIVLWCLQCNDAVALLLGFVFGRQLITTEISLKDNIEEAVADADIVVESVIEDLDIKREVIRRESFQLLLCACGCACACACACAC